MDEIERLMVLLVRRAGEYLKDVFDVLVASREKIPPLGRAVAREILLHVLGPVVFWIDGQGDELHLVRILAEPVLDARKARRKDGADRRAGSVYKIYDHGLVGIDQGLHPDFLSILV